MPSRIPSLNELRLCVDRDVPVDMAMDAALLAISETPANEPPPLILRPGVPVHPLEMALATPKKWSNGRKLGIRFLDGTKRQKTRTQKYAETWLEHANLSFDFNAGDSAEIRISFRKPGSWSALGTDCLAPLVFPKTEPTMNFGWLKDDTSESEWRRVVLHEFGHAMGAVHEHQNPQSGIQWNLDVVYRVFSGPPNNWTRAQIDLNIVQKYSVDQLNATDFDRKSIMLYAFPGHLIAGGKGTTNNSKLSDGDTQFIAEMYPRGEGLESLASAAPETRFSIDDFRRAAARVQSVRAR